MSYEYDNLPSGYPYDWSPATKGDRPWDQLDFHVDLGCGRVPKGRLGIDIRLPHPTPFPGIEMNLDDPKLELPFEDESVESIVSHHAMEHIGLGFERLIEECYRVLVFHGILRVIVPLFPSYTAVAEYDHKRYFMEGTFNGFCQEPDGGASMYDGFAERYNTACFRLVDEDCSPPSPVTRMWTPEDAREIRVTLQKHRPGTPDPDPKDYIP